MASGKRCLYSFCVLWPIILLIHFSADIVAAAALQHSQGVATSPPPEGASRKPNKKSKRSKKRLPLPANPPDSGHAFLARSSRSHRADATDERNYSKAEGTSSSVWSSGSDSKDGRFHSPISNSDLEEKSHMRHEKERQHSEDSRRRRQQLGCEQREHNNHRESALLGESSPEQPGQVMSRTRSKKIKPPVFPPGTYTPKVVQGGLELSSF